MKRVQDPQAHNKPDSGETTHGRVGDDAETEEQNEFKESLAGNRGTTERLDALYNDFKSPRIQGSYSDGFKFRPKQFLDWLEQWPHNKDENIEVIKEIRAIDFEKEISFMNRLFLCGGVDKYFVDTMMRHEKIERALETLCDFRQKTDASLSTPNSGTKRKHNGEPADNPDAKDAAGVVRLQGRWAHLEKWLKRIENYPFREISRLELSMIDGLEVWKTNDSEIVPKCLQRCNSNQLRLQQQ
eukprot:scaffold10152_cov167-Cylindrotheca_fusiformis.AAC.1